MSKLEEITAKINASKEVLSVLPKNNVKNTNIYMGKLEELKEEYTNYEKKILAEMKSRVEKVNKTKKEQDLTTTEEEVASVESILYLTNSIKTSYEKMGLDRSIHNLRFYYQKSLKTINENILYCIKKFKEVGISLRLDDFCYSKYVKEYLTSFFMGNDDIDLKKIQDKFEEIYWKCPNIITHIELNIRYLYLKHEKIIDKYYSKKQTELLGKVTSEDIINRYTELKKKLIQKQNEDKSAIVEGLIEGKLSVKDYVSGAIEARYANFISLETLKNVDESKLEEIDLKLEQLLNSVYEYKNYLKYKFISDNVKKIFMEKEKHKNTAVQTRKDIAAKEKKILQLNNKIIRKGIKKSADKLISEQEQLILEVKELYRELDTNRVYDKIATELSENSTIKDNLYLASSFYNYLFHCIKDNGDEIAPEEVEKDIVELENFMIWPYITIINNIRMLEEKDIALIIRDRYQLLNINISIQDLEPDNLDALISTIKAIRTGSTIRKNQIDVTELGFVGEFKKVLDA